MAQQSFATQWQQRKQHYLAQGFHPSEAGHYAWRDFGVAGPGAAEPDSDPSKKIEQVETPSQAATWQNHKTRYLEAGLCHKCAAQAAYGHQLGFSHSHPPCHECQPVVDGFPIDAVGRWRKLQSRPTGFQSHSGPPHGGFEVEAGTRG